MEVSVPEDPTVALPVSPSSSAEVGPVCAVCGFEALPGDLFCENCSAPLPGTEQTGAEVQAAVAAAVAGEAATVPGSTAGRASAATQPIEDDTLSATCANCGGTSFQDGYCSTCGAPAVKERDHWLEQPAAWVAAVCDRGVRHHRNEDAVALSALPEQGSRAVLVVCDGVSSSIDSDVASLAAARAARDVLSVVDNGGPSVAGRIGFWTDRLTEAARAANAQVVRVSREPTNRPGERQTSPASCTFVATVVDGPVIVAGWVGDSRAYWLPDAGPAEQLSVDDSWATEAVLAGMPRAQAESAPQSHAITRWLGVDSPEFQPTCAAATPDGPGWLLVCSDGLWNYCSPAGDIGRLVSRTSAEAGGDPARTATGLVNWANAQGGMDNITVALARLDGAAHSVTG
jgi:serine/threonine protein phosphatase PrpC/ribosomal protein L37E